MKKGISKWLIMLVVIVMSVPQIFALSQIRVRVNGTQVYFPDGQPYIDENSRVLVPVRFVSEQLGATVKWDKTAKRVTIVDGDNQAILTINSKRITVNGETKQLDTAAILKGTRTYVPLRFVSEALGATVRWDSKVRIVYIDNGKAPLPEVKVMEAGPFTVPITSGCSVTELGNDFTIETESQMQVYGGTDGNVIICIAPGMRVDYATQCEAAENLLQQIVSPTDAKKIVDFARTKTAIDHKIGQKKFDIENYIFIVSGNERTVNIRVNNK